MQNNSPKPFGQSFSISPFVGKIVHFFTENKYRIHQIVLEPLKPTFTPETSVTDSKQEITLAFDHDNEASCTVQKYDIYRDGQSVTSGITHTDKTYQDSGLIAGTIYQYEVTVTANSEESLRSESFSICTS